MTTPSSTDQHETVVEGDKLSRQVFAGMVDGKVLLHYIHTYIIHTTRKM